MGIDLPEESDTIIPGAGYTYWANWYDGPDCTGGTTWGVDTATGQEVLDFLDAGGDCVTGNCIGGCGPFGSMKLLSISED